MTAKQAADLGVEIIDVGNSQAQLDMCCFTMVPSSGTSRLL